LAINIYSQNITNYTFSALSGTFTPITGGTNANISSDDVISTAIPIGFTFYYMGIPYDKVYASSNGFLSFNSSATSTASNNLSTGTPRPLVAPLWDDLDGTTAGIASYITTGTAPNRVFTFEWLNWEWNYSANNAVISFQVKLYETTGVIEFIYRQEAGNVNSGSASIGIAATLTGAGNFLSLDGSGTNPNVSSITETTTIASKPATGQIYRFTPPAAPIAPSNLTFSGITGTQMTLNWVDNSTNETGFVIMYSIDGINYTNMANLPANTTTYTATNLSFATLYYWLVIAVNEGAGNYASGSAYTLNGAICGNKTVGGTGTPDYPSLTAAFNDINSQGLGCDVNLILQPGYDGSGEIYPLQPPKEYAIGSYTLTIYPAATGLVISSNTTTGTIDFDGSSNIVIDGRVNAVGNSPDLTIENTNIGSYYAVRFINGSSSNIIKYCNIKSVNNSTSSGTIVFSTSSSTKGNNNNVITKCNIYDGTSTPYIAIYSVGTTGKENTNNTISYNNIYNFWNASGSDYGIYIGGGNTSCIINSNNFYQTTTRAATAGATHYVIYISNSTSGNGFDISGNKIGGSQPDCNGTAWTVTGSYASRFVGIYINTQTVPLANSIQDNIITNFAWSSSSSSSTVPGVWCGIYLYGGNNNVGGLINNTIGALFGTGAITITASTTGGYSYGIVNSSSAPSIIISNNRIGSITLSGTTASISHGFYGIYSNYGSVTIENNIIGSNVSAKSITTPNSTGSTNEIIYGIYNSSSGNVTINNNIIMNLANQYAYATSNSVLSVVGIYSSSGSNTITNNTISNLSTTYGSSGTGSTASVIGIYLSSSTAGQLISKNNINSNHNSNAVASTSIIGIYYSGPTTGNNIIEKNFIHSLSLSAANASASINGIYVNGGKTTLKNNMIRLGIDMSGNSLLPAYSINGIYENAGTNDILFNSVYIGGNGVESGATNTYAFRSIVTINTRNYLNNIFVNNRSNGTSTGKHYAIAVAGSSPNPTGLTLNYNIYYANGTGGVLGFYNSADIPTLIDWQAAVGQDINSFYMDPMFVNPTGNSNNVNLHINTSVASIAEGNGLLISSVTDDFDDDNRANLTPTDIGADAFNGINIPLVTITAVNANPSNTQCSVTSRTISATTTAGISNISSVILYYSINGIQQGPLSMTGGTPTGTSTWTAVIPAVSPANALVTWYVIATDAYASVKVVGTPYQDEPFTGLNLTASISANSICEGSPITLTALFTSTTPAPTYAAPPAVSYPTTDEDIGNVTFGQLNNTTARNSLVGTIGTATGIAGDYSDFTTFGPFEIIAGQTYLLSVSTLQGTTSYNNAIGVYIDYNRNGTFTDPGEAVYVSSTTTLGAHTETAYVTVPLNASPGLTRMRVIVNEGLVTGPNMTVSYGEFEEYMLEIKNPNPSGITYNWSDGYSVIGTSNPLIVNPIVNTTYTVTAIDNNACTITYPSNLVVTTIPIPSTPIANNFTQCGLAVPNCSVTSTSGIISPVFNWYTSDTATIPIPGIVGNTYTGPPINQTTTFYVAEFDGTCESIRVPVIANVVIPDTVLIVATPSPYICLGNSLTLEAVQLGTTQNYDYEWTASPATGSGILTSLIGQNINITPTLPGTYVYNVIAEDVNMGCLTIDYDTILVRDLPSNVSASASLTQVCQGTPIDLFATPSSGQIALIDENFNAPTNNWTTINNSYGGNSANAAWTLRPDGWYESSTTFHSNDNSQFYLSNSDAQGSSSTTITYLESPSFDLTSGEVACSLSFYHYFKSYSGSVASVEIFDGSTWSLLKSYTTTTGSASAFANENIDLSGYIGISGLKIRFYYYATWGYFWAIDNVKIIAQYPSLNYEWTSNPVGFTSNIQNPTGIIPTNTTVYTVEVKDIYNCADYGSVTVDVVNPINVFLGNDTTICASQFITLDAGGAIANYLWSTGETTNSIIVDTTGYGLGSFNIWVEVDNGCISVDTIEVTFDACTGIYGDANNNIEFSVYPNPVNDKIHIISSNINDDVIISISTYDGKLLFSEYTKNYTNYINKEYDMSLYSSGVYFVRITVNGYNKVIPFIKN